MAKTKIYRGAVIPYFHDADGQLLMLFMKPSENRYGGHQFQIAKGKFEDGEDAETAAFREAREELGLFKPNCSEITNLGVFLGRTTVFHCRVEDPTDSMFGKPCDETEATQWMTPEEFEAEGRVLHKPVVRAAVRSIERTNPSSYPPLLEMFDFNPDLIDSYTQNGNTISGTFFINDNEYRCDIEIITVTEARIPAANISFGKVVDGEVSYDLTGDKTVSAIRVGAAARTVIDAKLPQDVKVLLFAAAPENGALERRFRIYKTIAQRYAKTGRFGQHYERFQTANGGLVSIVWSSELPDQQKQAVMKWASTNLGK